MSICSHICDEIAAELRKDARFQNIEIVNAYENNIKPVPIESVIVALSVKKCVLGANVIDIADNGEETVTGNRRAKSTVSVNIYLPYSYKVKTGAEIFENAMDVIIKKHNSQIESAACYETNYVREAQALVTKAEIIFKTVGMYE